MTIETLMAISVTVIAAMMVLALAFSHPCPSPGSPDSP
jgi:hypothetical protein